MLGMLCVSTLISHISYLTVTNHVGHCIAGELTAVTNGTFVIDGRAYPLSVLPKSEQKRVRAAAGEDVRTPKEKRIAADLAYELKRIDARRKEGEISDEEAERLRGLQRESAAARLRRSPEKANLSSSQ